MRLGIMQPYFFPYIGYWQLISAVDKYVVFDDVNYINRGWVNRNRLLINGQDRMVSLKLHESSQNKLINEIEILEDQDNRANLIKTIENCYRKAPYYKAAFPVIEDIISLQEKNLALYLKNSIQQLCSYLSLDAELIDSSSIKKDNSLRGQNKILEICRLLRADEYINAIGGRDLYSHEMFSSSNIALKFLKPTIIEYRQFGNEFIPSLSIIDVMMFNSSEEIKKMLSSYELID
ncbi:MAG: WbqC family protein [Clostridiaceae bacterium]